MHVFTKCGSSSSSGTCATAYSCQLLSRGEYCRGPCDARQLTYMYMRRDEQVHIIAMYSIIRREYCRGPCDARQLSSHICRMGWTSQYNCMTKLFREYCQGACKVRQPPHEAGWTSNAGTNSFGVWGWINEPIVPVYIVSVHCQEVGYTVSVHCRGVLENTSPEDQEITWGPRGTSRGSRKI